MFHPVSRLKGMTSTSSSSTEYDVIVVGARCAGSATARLLALQGHRVLVVDRVHPRAGRVPSAGNVVTPGAYLLKQWGLLDELVARGCPPVTGQRVHAGGQVTEGPAGGVGGIDAMYVADHAVLDPLLCEAAEAAGAEVRIGVRVDDLLWDGDRVSGITGSGPGGERIDVWAPLVVGADGKHSFVARAVGATTYRERAAGQCAYDAFWRNTGHRELEIFLAEGRACIVFPTHDERSWVVCARPMAEWDAFKADPVAEYHRQIEAFPELARAMEGATLDSRYHGNGDLDGFFRQASGPGWALVGDAGHTKDPGPGRGISDAFIQADLLAEAVDDALRGRRSWEKALGEFGRVRDEYSTGVYDLTHEMAMHPPPAQAGELAARMGQASMRQMSWLIERVESRQLAAAAV